MNGHRFGWSGRCGVGRCACGTERTLLEEGNPPYRPFWWYRLEGKDAHEAIGYSNVTRSEGREPWPCAKAAA